MVKPEAKKEQKPMYIAGYRKPGLLPEEIMRFETQDEAKRWVIAKLLDKASRAKTEKDAEAFAFEAEGMNLESGEFSTCNALLPDRLVYFVEMDPWQ